jgi:hypothetical protein
MAKIGPEDLCREPLTRWPIEPDGKVTVVASGSLIEAEALVTAEAQKLAKRVSDATGF